jgi:hypothetical protein
VFDLRTRVIKWQQHLDLTTATTKFTAHMFSSPTLADIDADGHMEVVVGTSVGFVYVLNSRVSSTSIFGHHLCIAAVRGTARGSNMFLRVHRIGFLNMLAVGWRWWWARAWALSTCSIAG